MVAVDPVAWAVDAFKDADLARDYDRYARYADGDQNLAFATPKFESTFGALFDAFSYNRCGPVIGAHVDRLHVTGFAADADADGARAKEIWDRNRMDKRQGELFAEALTAGVGYLLVWPDAGGQATLWPQLAEYVRVRRDPERPGEVEAAAKAWRVDGHVRLNVYGRDRVRRFVSRTKVHGDAPVSAKAFDPYDGDGEASDFFHPYGVVPIVPFPNGGRIGGHGRSELRDVIPVQDALNKTLTDKMVAMELAAYPQRVILGLDPTPPVLDPLTGAVAIDPITGAPPDPLAGPLRRFQAGMDRILTITGQNARIAEFQAVMLAQFIAVAEFWDAAISRVSKVPVHYLTLSGNFPSGRALRTAEAPFVAKLERMQRGFGNAVEDAMALALRIEGVAEPAGGYGLSTLWRSAAPMSEEDEWDLALQKAGVGMPLRQILVEKGYDDAVLDAILGTVEAERARVEREETAKLDAAMTRFAAGAGRDDEDDGEGG